jgi:hypothetical protein
VASATITAATAELVVGSADATAKTVATTDATPAVSSVTAASWVSDWVSKDRARKGLWWLLATLAASQLYFVRELVAAFALFVLAFGAIAAVVVAIYMLQKSWELALARLTPMRQPNLQVSPIPHDTRKPA